MFTVLAVCGQQTNQLELKIAEDQGPGREGRLQSQNVWDPASEFLTDYFEAFTYVSDYSAVSNTST